MHENDTYIHRETHKTLYKKIDTAYLAGNSYDKIGLELLPEQKRSVAKLIIWRAHKKNEWPKDNEIRLQLSLPRYVVRQENNIAPACPTCGGACTYDCGTQRPQATPGTHPPRKRRAINLVDAESAAATIIPRVSTAYRRRLAELLDY